MTLKKPGVKLEHQGIKVEFVGEIELYQDRGNHHEFTSLVKDLARAGDLIQNSSYSFEFVNVEKPYESYTGSNVRLRFVSAFFSLLYLQTVTVISTLTSRQVFLTGDNHEALIRCGERDRDHRTYPFILS